MREAFRSFRRAPGVWTGVILSLALGTGANIALFSIINGLMLRPLQVADPDSLALVRTVGGGEAWRDAMFSIATLSDQVSGSVRQERLVAMLSRPSSAFWRCCWPGLDCSG